MKSVLHMLIFFSGFVQYSFAVPLVRYGSSPDKFVTRFADCARDKLCHFYFWHITKTGGTTIERSFYQMFAMPIKKACCNDHMMARFTEDTDSYCRSKFSSYEVFGGQMLKVVETCMKLQPNSRAIIFFTFREPISRFYWNINHMCNKNLELRSEEWLKVCRRCTYAADTEVFLNEWIEKHNYKYMSIYNITEMDVRNAQVLFLDTMDINGFVEKLKFEVQEYFNLTLVYINIEYATSCDFRLTSDIVRELAPSSIIYRNITTMEL